MLPQLGVNIIGVSVAVMRPLASTVNGVTLVPSLLYSPATTPVEVRLTFTDSVPLPLASPLNTMVLSPVFVPLLVPLNVPSCVASVPRPSMVAYD